DFTAATPSVAQTQMVAASNADTGYTISVNGTTLTSGTNIIPALAVPDVSRPGVSQFGLNIVANTNPTVGANPSGAGTGVAASGYNQPNFYKFVSGDIVAGVPN